MKIFAVDSTAKTASVALCEDGRLLAQFTQNGTNTHSETLLPMTDVLLRSMNCDISDIDLFALSAGPGSFTGVRIGAATIKGLAHTAQKPCVGVSTLKALAYNLICFEGALVCPVMDARRNQFYTATFRVTGGSLERIADDRAISIDQFTNEVLSFGEQIYLCGDGYNLAKNALGTEFSFDTPEPLIYQSAYSVAQVAKESFAQNGGVSADSLRPTYLRLPQAERDRLAAMENK